MVTGVIPNFDDMPIDTPAAFDSGAQAYSSRAGIVPNPLFQSSALSDEGFTDSLLDLVDWDASLENCNPDSWDWNQGMQ
jgi:hypothetical protein